MIRKGKRTKAEDKERVLKFVERVFDKTLYKYQLDFLVDCLTLQRVNASFCRQSGKTMTIAIFSILHALLHPDNQLLIVAPTDEQASLLFNKIRNWLVSRPVLKTTYSRMSMREVHFKNGSQIKSITTGDYGTTIRGHTADVLILEECAFIKDEIYTSVLRPLILATKGKIIGISTPHGNIGFFYRHFHSDNWKSHHVPWQMVVKAGHCSKAEIMEAKEETEALEFQSEYEAIFVAAASAYFDLELIKSCVENIPLIRERDLV